MREKQERIVITFYTTADAMAMEKAARLHGIDGKSISAPRAVSADCGIAFSSPISEKENVMRLLSESGIEIQGAHELWL